MKWSLTIAKVAGVPIRVHVSFALLIVLVAASAGGMSATVLEDYIVWIALLFACVTVHELSHSVVARRLGLKVRDIVLLPIGGVSEIEGMGSSPAVEGKVAIAGPLASVALGAIFLGLAAATHAALWPPNLSLTTGSWLERLGWLNLALAAFNLLPALPMDGGRVFRSVLSHFANPVRATRIAAVVAIALSVGMIGFGVEDDDFFLVLIGLFVLLGAWSEWQGARIRDVTSGLTVAALMHGDATTVPTRVPAAEVVGWLAYFPGRAVPVVDDYGRYVGIVDVGDLSRVGPHDPVGSAADTQAPLLAPAMELFPSVLQAFQVAHRQELAVAADGHVIGVLYFPAVAAALHRARGGYPDPVRV